MKKRISIDTYDEHHLDPRERRLANLPKDYVTEWDSRGRPYKRKRGRPVGQRTRR